MVATMSGTEEDLVARLVGAVSRGSVAVVSGALFALPGFLLVRHVAPESAGFYLLAFATLASHATLRRLDDSNESVELGDRSRSELYVILVALLLAAVLSVSVRLLMAVGISIVVGPEIWSESAVGSVFLAVAVPLADLWLADTDVRLSPSALAGLAGAWLVGSVYGLFGNSSGPISDAVGGTGGRIGPI